jgi:cobalamin biosynthesis protein CobD/CbiB
MRQPTNLAEAKQIFREEKAKVTGSISAIAGSRWLMAILATLVIAFGTHLIYAPARLPAVGGVSLAVVGLPPTVDFGFAGDQAKQAAEAARNSEARTRAEEFVAANQERIPIFNAVMFGLSLLLLLGNLWIMTKRRPYSRG